MYPIRTDQPVSNIWNCKDTTGKKYEHKVSPKFPNNFNIVNVHAK